MGDDSPENKDPKNYFCIDKLSLYYSEPGLKL